MPKNHFELDARAFNRGLGAAAARITRGVEHEVNRLADEIEANARSVAPVDTGALRDSIYSVAGRDEKGYFVAVGTSIEYGPAVEFGKSRRRVRGVRRAFLRSSFFGARRALRKPRV